MVSLFSAQNIKIMIIGAVGTMVGLIAYDFVKRWIPAA